MAIEWTADLATGSVEIDSQHKEIFRRINDMLEACRRAEGKEKVPGLLAFLEDYVIKHFGTEERFMKDSRFPGYAEHRTAHENLAGQIGALRAKIEKEGIGVHTVVATNQLLVHAFIGHIMKMDVQLAAHLKKK